MPIALRVFFVIKEDEIFNSINDTMTLEEKVRHIYRLEVMKTSVDGRYSGYLQIALLAGLLNVGIHQHCLRYGYELYNCKILPLRHCSNSAIHILWRTLSNGVMNHIVPLVRCQTNEQFNTFSDHFDTVCAASSLCQFHANLDKANGEQWLMCDKCLLWYHEGCVYYAKQKRMPAHWFCGCVEKPECIWEDSLDDPSTPPIFCSLTNFKC